MTFPMQTTSCCPGSRQASDERISDFAVSLGTSVSTLENGRWKQTTCLESNGAKTRLDFASFDLTSQQSTLVGSRDSSIQNPCPSVIKKLFVDSSS